jgi:transposase
VVDPYARIRDLEADNAGLRTLIEELRETNDRLRDRVEKLEAERSRHSGNSSKPPSSDTVTQRAAQNARRSGWSKKPKGRVGKQAGTKGKHLAQVAAPDRVVRHAPAACPSCGDSLDDAAVVSVQRRQVFDIPEPKVAVTEHVAERRRCGCGAVAAALFPPEATAPACWGPAVRSLGTYLLVRQHLPVARTAELLEDVLGAPVSTGWLAGLAAEAAGGLDGFLTDLKGRLLASHLLHVDETGARICGARQWFHVCSTRLLTLLDCHAKRGVEATDAMGVLPSFGGVAMHDRWKPYWRYGCTHAICGAHVLRDLAGVAEIPSQTAWAEAMARLLLDAKQAQELAADAGDEAVGATERERIRARYDRVVAEGIAANPTPIRWSGRTSLERQSYNLAVALRDHKDEALRYLDDGSLPFDNNQGERDLRMVKVQQKVSGGFRTPEGARHFCAVRSYIATARKHGVPALDVLTRLFVGTPWAIPDPVPG